MSKPAYVAAVCDVVRAVPAGRVTTYGAIAAYLGLGSARSVGFALKMSLGDDVPAHRVVNRQGLLTGRLHFGHPDLMAALLTQEGIRVENNRVVDFDRLFWSPSVHLV